MQQELNPPQPSQEWLNPRQPLRRGLACLQCKRRKLKCDAGKPHCKTCVRSHAHALKTGSSVNPVLDCQYADEMNGFASGADATGFTSHHPNSGNEENHGAKRQRKEGAAAKRRRTSDDGTAADKGLSKKDALSLLIKGCDAEELKELFAMMQVEAHHVSPADTTSPDVPSRAATSAIVQGRPRSSADATWSNSSFHTSPENIEDGITGPSRLLDLLSSAAAAVDGPNQLINDENIELISAYTAFGVAPVSGMTQRLQPHVEDLLDDDGPMISGPASMMDQGNEKVPRMTTNSTVFDEAAYLQDVFYPGWPKNLPGPVMMDQIIDIFFAVVPIVPNIFQRSRFLLRMTLPPTHHDFPYVGVLHAICAAVSRHFGGVYTEPISAKIWEARRPVDDPSMVMCFGRRHETFARRELEQSLSQSEHFYGVAQTLTILLHYYYTEGLWLDGWTACGILARVLHPLGLMSPTGYKHRPAGKVAVLGPPKDDIDKNERYNLVWVAAFYDVMAEGVTSWPGALNFDELDIPLPTDLSAFDGTSSTLPVNDQTANSLDLWTRHPIEDSFCILSKICLLLHKINRYQDMLHRTDGFENARNSSQFADLDAQIMTFIVAFPSSLRDPLAPPKVRHRKTMDNALLTAQLMLHFMALKLHEPFADYSDPQNPSARRMLAASKGILKLIYLLSATTYDIRSATHCEYAVMAAARAFINMLQEEMKTGIAVGGSRATMLAELDVFRMMFSSRGQSFPIGLRMGLIIDAMSEGVRKGDSADESFDESCGPAKQYKFVHAFKAEGETC